MKETLNPTQKELSKKVIIKLWGEIDEKIHDLEPQSFPSSKSRGKREVNKAKKRRNSYLCSLREVVSCEFAFQSEFMHNPIGLLSLWSSPSVED